MPEIRCPSCGMSNASDAEKCFFCGEALSPGAASQPPAESSEADLPDWLASLREGNWQAEPSTPTGGEESPSGDNLPDWFSRIQPPSPEEHPVSEPAAGEPSAPASFDWLQEPTSETSAPEGSADDWLAGLGSSAGGSSGDFSDEDWLARLRGESPHAEEPQSPVPEPPWSASQPPGFPDTEASLPASSPEEEGELASWLAGFTPPEEESASTPPPEEELPEWLSTAPAEESPVEPAPASSLPDWLQPEAPASQDETPAEAVGGLPAWLAGLEEPAPPQEAPFEPPAGLEGELPAWLTGLEEPAPRQEVPFEPPADLEKEGELPAFLTEDQPAPPADTPAGIPLAGPDFSTFFSAEEASPEAGGSDQPPVEPPSPSAEPETLPEPEIPDWLHAFAETETGQGLDQAALPAEGVGPFIDETMPEWLSKIRPETAPSPSEQVPPLLETEPEVSPQELSSPFQVDLPEWLSNQPVGEPTPPSEEPFPEEAGEELARGELPEWVEDLRPLEAVIPATPQADTSEKFVEKSGPLSGMRGVLPVEELPFHYRKPPVYSAKLRISERQRSQAAILENLLGLETQPSAVPSEPSRAPAMILRVLIALLFILSLLTMLLPDFHLVELPAVIPAGTDALYTRVENLPENAAVLLAVDYEPGLSGEMRYAANSIIEHLMIKNARLITVSTVPTGPVLAEDLLNEALLRRPTYALSERTVNLGYLPGGTTSLLEFAHNPRGAAPSALDTPLNGIPAWERPATAGLQSLQDFALILVLTDSPETGRAWIEQVQPTLQGVPLSMVTSAQAGPLLQPYFDSGQLQGLSVGLQGGAFYEQRSGRVNLANRFWGAYQSAALVGLILLVIGGTVSALLGSTSRKPKSKGRI